MNWIWIFTYIYIYIYFFFFICYTFVQFFCLSLSQWCGLERLNFRPAWCWLGLVGEVARPDSDCWSLCFCWWRRTCTSLDLGGSAMLRLIVVPGNGGALGIGGHFSPLPLAVPLNVGTFGGGCCVLELLLSPFFCKKRFLVMSLSTNTCCEWCN